MGKRKSDAFIGKSIPKELLDMNWIQNSSNSTQEYCEYKGYSIERERLEKKFFYTIEFASGYRDSSNGLTLNIHIGTDLNHIIEYTNNFAWQYACNMFSDKTALRPMERKQIANVLDHIFGCEKLVVEDEYSGQPLPQELMDSVWTNQWGSEKNTTYKGMLCKIRSVDDMNSTREMWILGPSNVRKPVYLALIFKTNFDNVIQSFTVRSFNKDKGALDLGILNEEIQVVKDFLQVLFRESREENKL